MTYINSPIIADANIDGTLAATKVFQTSATQTVANTFAGLETTPGLKISQSFSEAYATPATGTTITPTSGYYTVEVGASFTGNLTLNHSSADKGCMIIIKNLRGSSLTVVGSSPVTTATANGGPVTSTTSATTPLTTTTAAGTPGALTVASNAGFAVGDRLEIRNTSGTLLSDGNNTYFTIAAGGISGTTGIVLTTIPNTSVLSGYAVASRTLKFTTLSSSFMVNDSLSGNNVPSGATIAAINSVPATKTVFMSAGVTTAITTSTVITANRNYITLTATPSSNIQIGQQITSVGGAVGTSTVVNAINYPGTNQIYLSNQPTAALSSTSVTFQSFIDYTYDSNYGFTVVGPTSVTVADKGYLRLISDGAKWLIAGLSS